jgi:hypothetical protein
LKTRARCRANGAEDISLGQRPGHHPAALAAPEATLGEMFFDAKLVHGSLFGGNSASTAHLKCTEDVDWIEPWNFQTLRDSA